MILKPLTHPISAIKKCAGLALFVSLCGSAAQAALSAEAPIPPTDNTAPIVPVAQPAVAAPVIPDNPLAILISGKQLALLPHANFSRDSELLNQVYQNNNYQLLWLGPNRSDKNLTDLIQILDNAPNDGLKAVNYDAEQIKQIIANNRLTGASQNQDTLIAQDLALTLSLVRYLHDLHQGQVNPRDIQYQVLPASERQPLDLAAPLRQHLENQSLTELIKQFEPKSRQYVQLKQILTNLRQLPTNDSGVFKLGKVLHPGEKHPQLDVLRSRLKAAGVLAETATGSDKIYDGDLVNAVKKIQESQGLKADGVIGPSTAALLTQSPAERINQIELSMERARWLPEVAEGPMIIVNIPAFQLWAFNNPSDPNPLNMRVIVGKSPDNLTPVLWEEMKYLEFMPYWNIPKSILEKEIWPKVANNESYLANQDIELIRHQNSEESGGGSYMRARQRPGKNNPLGRVKFVFPNKADVYMHDTPGHAAFSRDKRDLSHGCVRVSEPEKLAQFVLNDQEGWGVDKIREAMSAAKTRHVTLKRAVPVLFYYSTAFIDYNNQLRIYPDVYGQDALLQQALDKLQTPSASSLSQSSGNTKIATAKPAEPGP
jgi:L,D-transpeptidase YcbB